MSKINQQCWWLQSLDENILPNTSLQGENKSDVIITGGGFTGLSAAIHLKRLQPSLTVAVLESQYCGYGASGRNGGFSMTLFGLTKEITQLRFGKEKAIEAQHYMEEAVDYQADFIKENKIDCDYERSGYLLVSASKAQEKRVEKEFKIAEKWGLKNIERWDTPRLRQEFQTQLYRNGWYEPRCGILHPAKFVRALKHLAEAMGVVIYENSPVISIDKKPSGSVEVTTTSGKISGSRLVLATNAYSVNVPLIRQKQTPVFTHIVLTEPLTDAQMQSIGWANRAGIEDARNLVHYYRLTKDNRIVMGGGDVSIGYGKNLNKDLNPSTFRHLEEHLIEIFPQIKGIRFTHRWGGPVSITTDLAPAIGYLGEDRKIIYSLGCVGHGVSLTLLNGLTIAEMITGIKSHRTDKFFVGRTVIPWTPEPIRFIIGHGIKAYLKMEDRLIYK